ncbi:MAG: hypothetical protein K2N94_02370, partial [Lachnospiraceae bacterium]|nr:hypothetical protein [Lachnospiraceae bacterium]
MTQLLYSCNSKTYFCKNGEKEEETVAKGTIFPILPDNVQNYQETVYTEETNVSVTVYGTGDLSGLVCEINDGLYYIDKDMSAQRIVSSYTDCEVSADGTALLYLRGDSLYRVKNLKKSLEPEKIEDIEGVSGFAANKDLNRLYYLNDDNELMYFGGSGKPVKIYDDDIKSVLVVGDKLYFVGDYSRGTGTLYVSDKGSKRKSIAEVAEIENLAGRLYYTTEDNELYMLDGDKPVKVLDDIAN